MGELGKAVIAQPRGVDGVCFAFEVGIAGSWAEDLQLDTRLVHELESSGELIRGVGGGIAKARLIARAQTCHQLGVPLGVVVAVDVDQGTRTMSRS